MEGLPDERTPCPICGIADCGPEGDKPDHVLFKEWARDHKPPTPRSPAMGDVVAKSRIWKKVPIPKTDRTSKLLAYKPGDVIPEDEARALNVNADGLQSEVPTIEHAGTATVPLSPEPSAKAAKKAAPKKKAAPAKKAPAKKTAAKKAAAAKKA